MTLKFGNKKWFLFLISILFLTDLSILLNIPFYRQIFGVFFLTILPGILILHILKLNKIEYTEKVVLSVGVSISFLMIFGLILNYLYLSLGYITPLSTISLLISFNIVFVILCIIGYKINKYPIFSKPNFNLNTTEKAFLIIPILFPALSILGMHIMNTTDDNILLMSLLVLIPAYVICVCFFNSKFPNRLYPGVILSISISLLLLYSLRSNHIIGVDTHLEYYFFQITLDNKYWSILGSSIFDATLSISLLPVIYQSILNIPAEFLFKIIYSLIYSISPLVIYIISKKYVEDLYAFLASCVFMFQSNFLMTALNSRTNIAILFFGLAIMTLFNDKINPVIKRLLFITFLASIIFSHYSTTYIFFIMMLVVFMGTELLSKIYTVKKEISLTLISIFFCLLFVWYSQITETAFYSGIDFIVTMVNNFKNMFLEESRVGVPAVLGSKIIQKGIPHKIEFIFTWLIFAFIGIGILTMIIRYKEMVLLELNLKKPLFLKEKFDVEYSMFAIVCVGLLILMVVLPFVSVGYGIDRLYGMTITILSLFFIIGGIIISKYLKVKPFIIILLVLIPYFFSISGITYNLFGVDRSIILNSMGEQQYLLVHDQDSKTAKWFEKYINTQELILSDFIGGLILTSQGKLPLGLMSRNLYTKDKKNKHYIYLRYNNIINREIQIINNGIFQLNKMSDYIDLFITRNKIYNNGGSEVWI